MKWSAKAVELGEGEVKGQLAEELKSYQASKPWRERQQTVENDSSEPNPSDLELDVPDEVNAETGELTGATSKGSDPATKPKEPNNESNDGQSRNK